MAMSELRAVVSDRTFQIAGLALAALTALQWAAVDDRASSVAAVAYTLVPLAALAWVVAALLSARRWVAAGALLVAISPSVLTSVTAGERHGAVAMLVACGAAMLPTWFTRDAGIALTSIVATAVVALALWWGSGVSRGGAPSPGWREIVNSTGDDLRAGFGVVGGAGAPLPTSAHLAWWCAVGFVVGCALLGTRAATAVVVPSSVALFVVVAWAITRWRGPVDAAGGMWLVAGALAFTGASAGVQPEADRRLGRLVIGASASIWAIAFVRLFRDANAGPGWWLGALAVIGALTAVLVSADRISGAADER